MRGEHLLRKGAALFLEIFMPNRIPLAAITFSETSRRSALTTIESFFALSGGPSYIGVLNVFMAMSANRDIPELVDYYNESLLTVPDGMPLVWYGQALGFDKVQRTCGPDLMVDLLKISGVKKYSHYFIGSTPETLDLMQKELARRFPGAKVVGTESPPFRPLTDEEVRIMADTINRLNPSFVWIGMSAPKQELLIQRLLPLVTCNTIFSGVGLAFSYLAGEVQKAPQLVQRCGLEWVWRCAQQPGKLKPKTFYRLMSFLPGLTKAILFKKPMGRHPGLIK
jgi:N-acetylglucosaminyldiphosphoundecaprenol N-acetyl-beta-D-mannosaminyltransferase